jgi:hypothetical protein
MAHAPLRRYRAGATERAAMGGARTSCRAGKRGEPGST